jgi:hypothetical protein
MKNYKERESELNEFYNWGNHDKPVFFVDRGFIKGIFDGGSNFLDAVNEDDLDDLMGVS